ncbi:MAPEG family protein [Kordiimonas aquimaris]|uniref:MAPEG family protein n=1 Tax=Kordiimonas aquimaris TaxID=707591 RepID=UPI0021CFEB66|nr:MAPEG family protein [Kordiimonas aquimaris]
MQSILETMPQLAAYQTALLVLAALCLIVLLQSFLGAPLAFIKNEQVPGAPLQGDHALFSFRVLRTYANSVESLPAFGFPVLLAVLVGVDAEMVNLLAVIHLVFRLAFWAVYYAGIGKPAGGPRTLCYVGGLLSNVVLIVMVILQLA